MISGFKWLECREVKTVDWRRKMFLTLSSGMESFKRHKQSPETMLKLNLIELNGTARKTSKNLGITPLTKKKVDIGQQGTHLQSCCNVFRCGPNPQM